MGVLQLILAILLAVVLLIFVVIVLLLLLLKKSTTEKKLVVYKKQGGKITRYQIISQNRCLCLPIVHKWGYLPNVIYDEIIVVESLKIKKEETLNLSVDLKVNISFDRDRAFNAVNQLLNLTPEKVSELIKKECQNVIENLCKNYDTKQIKQNFDMFVPRLYADIDTSLSRFGLELKDIKVYNVTDEKGLVIV